MPRERTSDQRLSRQDWLENALATLSEKGQAGLSIQDLSVALGVSRGSFYWHFEDRDDFVHALLEHWYEEYTAVAPVAWVWRSAHFIEVAAPAGSGVTWGYRSTL